ncbi:MAG: DUF6502 family protein [Agarilytica sp.]
MSNSIKDHVSSALRKLLEPIIMMMLRNNVTYKQFSSLCKTIFVEVAARDFGIRGRPTNVSRIAVLTGLDRKEVKRVKDLIQDNQLSTNTQNSQDRLTRVLSAWHLDSEFLDERGQPLLLPSEGEAQSFSALAKKYGGDIPASTLLKELVRGEAIDELDDGTLRVTQRYFFPSQSDPEALIRAGSVVHDLGATLFHNLYEGGGSEKPLRFERRASNHRVDPATAKAFRAFVEREGQMFLERVDEWLSAHELPESEAGKDAHKNIEGVRLGVGAYLIEEDEKQNPLTTRNQPNKNDDDKDATEV